MNICKWFFVIVLVSSSSLFAQNETNSSILIREFDDEVYKELSLTEWKKFKSFEQKLRLGAKSNTGKQEELRSYARDSIQILEVKLMAVKLLNEKKLLDRDIAENTSYYVLFLDELRESGIPRAEYIFLEEKMAYFNQAIVEEQLVQSKWFNMILVVLSLSLICLVISLKIKQRKTRVPKLSKQEVNVRNLMLQGKSNKEIANELFISLSTVKSHITNLYAKLDISNRQQLIKNSTRTST